MKAAAKIRKAYEASRPGWRGGNVKRKHLKGMNGGGGETGERRRHGEIMRLLAKIRRLIMQWPQRRRGPAA